MICKKLLHLTQHKKFGLYVPPNFCYAKTSFILVPLSKICPKAKRREMLWLKNEENTWTGTMM